jgi:hypothetical protein
MPNLLEFRITFGQKHATKTHLAFLAGRVDFDPHPDGWLTVLAPDETAARRLLHDRLELAWSWIYLPGNPLWPEIDWSLFPLGELARWTTEQPEPAP